MKFVVAGKEYGFNGINRLTIWDLLELEKQTGFTFQTLQTKSTELADQAAQAKEDGDTEAASMMNSGTLKMIGVLVWLARIKSGETLTFEQSLKECVLEELEVIDDDEEQAPDPTSSDGGQAANAA